MFQHVSYVLCWHQLFEFRFVIAMKSSPLLNGLVGVRHLDHGVQQGGGELEKAARVGSSAAESG
jgi:hypothetical protein